ncbi:AAA family ATPase [Thiotrichales bacterium HSG1]|nr:AAA family ATPase [Thiotrichales bacterium HSG1]
MLILPNYKIDSQIYESANSLIYRGYRNNDNQPVILKMLKQDYPSPTELNRYQQEFEITSNLASNGIIKTYDIEKYQNTLVIILEDFDGSSLKQLMLERAFNLKDFFSFAIQITEGLGYIHAANIIHKDINPSNIIINPKTKQVKIIDFGIASRLPRENPTLTNPEQLEGTLAYLSPEQTGRINRSIDYHTDLYSLGITFYEMLTGKLPFTATDAMELVHCHIAKTPIPVCEVNPEIPPIVSDIIMKLLAKNAEDRYQSAFGVKADLEKVLNLPGLEDLEGLQFELAQHDFSGKFQIPQKIYGRETEVETLLAAFERISDGKAEMMLVSGYSGVGKTAIVHEVHKPMTKKNGYFAAGKFDQFQKNIPYSAITQAFNEFCRYLLLENSETLANWQTKIKDAIGNNGQIIIDVVPDLELIIGKQPAVVKVGPTEAQNRFQIFFLNFVKVLCDKEHPFILFIDDLQWVDSASLSLLKNIMLDDEIQNLLIIGAYRDNEVDNTHPFIMAVSELQKANVIINTIELTNLQLEDINHLLQDTLSCEAIQLLGKLIYQKTQGNAFFTHQFLQTLYEEELLQFNSEQWQWNIEQIKSQNITANVVELMANKIDKLPEKTSAILRLAACIGNQFDLFMLVIIAELNQEKALKKLQPAIIEGLIQPLDENSQFKFLHDRVQQAAYAQVDDAHRKNIHLQIGRLLLKNTDSLEDKVFEVVGHFNNSIELIRESTERLEIAKLNLMAGQKAKLANAYEAAVNYLTIGKECLPEKSWETDYDLTLNIFTEMVEAAYLSGNFEQMEQLVQIVLQRTRTLSDEAKIYKIQISAYVAQNQQQEAIKTALIFLKQLSINLPTEPTQEDIGLTLQETQAFLSGKSIQTIIDLPIMTNLDKILAMRIMEAVSAAAFVASPGLMVLLVLKQVNLSLEHGNCSESSYSYAFYGLILCGVVSDIESGYQFGRLALNLLERLNEKRLKINIVHIFNGHIRFWKEHLGKTLQPLLENYQTGLEIGNLEYGGYSLQMYTSYSFFANKQLVILEQEMAMYSSSLNRLKQKAPLNWLNISWQTVLNLRGDSNNPCILNGKAYDENIQLPVHQQANDRTSIYFLHFYKSFLHYLFQEYITAIENAEIAEQHLDGAISLIMVPVFHFYDSLAKLAVYPNLSQQEQENVLTKVTANQEKMKLWAEHAPMNFQHKYDLVEAEKARVQEQNWQAIELYDKAIAGAKENQYLQEEALANELTAKFWLEQGNEKIAQIYLKETHYLYQQWGALAKVADLEVKYPQLLAVVKTFDSNITATISTLMTSVSNKLQTSTILDLESVTKASQTLAGEIVLSELLEKMMHIVIENAEAERGLLILKQDDSWVIEAEGLLDSKKVTIQQSIPLEGNLPCSIVNYVTRSHEPVVLANAIQEGIYTEDSYILQHQLKSILCSPILHQGKLIGVLYVENNLIEGAFTPARFKMIDMLSSQAAISLENALLYRTLEQKVEQRTEQLATANQEITLLNERLEEENVRMGAELDVAKQLQQMVLPKETELQQIDNLDIAGFMEPAEEVGGDYYEVLNHDGHIKIGIGDVTGHGLESGVLMLMVQTMVRALLLAGIDNPEQFLNIVNRTVYHNTQRMETDKNLTLSLLDYHAGNLTITGQHEEILLVRKDGKVELIDTFYLGFMVGVVDDVSEFTSHQEISLQSGDGIVLYTDGITEAQNIENIQYGLEKLCEVVSKNWAGNAKQVQQSVIANVKDYIGEREILDDITLLVLKQK